MNPETKIQAAVRYAVNSSGKARVWRNQVGKLPNGRGGFISTGLGKGSADLIGYIIGDPAIFLALEIKTDTGKPSPEQLAWGKIVAKDGGIYAIVRSPSEAMKIVIDASRR